MKKIALIVGVALAISACGGQSGDAKANENGVGGARPLEQPGTVKNH
jgi:hypothetical protein